LSDGPPVLSSLESELPEEKWRTVENAGSLHLIEGLLAKDDVALGETRLNVRRVQEDIDVAINMGFIFDEGKTLAPVFFFTSLDGENKLRAGYRRSD